jgi:hypothetical protein
MGITMSRHTLEAIIGRAILDQEFRFALFADPEAALAGYELAREEMAVLKLLDAESLDACGDSVGRRVAVALRPLQVDRGADHGSTEQQTPSSG